ATSAEHVRYQSEATEASAHAPATGGYADQVAMHLVGGQRIIEDVGIRHRLDNGAFEGRMAWIGSVGAASPCLSRRGQGAAAHLRSPNAGCGWRTYLCCFMYEEIRRPGFRVRSLRYTAWG